MFVTYHVIPVCRIISLLDKHTCCVFQDMCVLNTSARLAQMVERMTLNHVVAGSIPAVGDNVYVYDQ